MIIMKILVALDGSTYSEAAVNTVAKHPWPEATEIRFITVETPWLSEFSRIGATNMFDDVNAGIRRESLGILNHAAAEIQSKTAGKLSVSTTLREGDPKEIILDEARRWEADCIVVGSHGKKTISRFFLGSVSLAIATHAPCSVWIVR
jgi:nucleotide-binding universal stress UspA family protein